MSLFPLMLRIGFPFFVVTAVRLGEEATSLDRLPAAQAIFVVVGRVTNTTARILIELDQVEKSVSASAVIPPIHLRKQNGKTTILPVTDKKMWARLFNERRPAVIRFKGLEPSTKYTVLLAKGISLPPALKNTGSSLTTMMTVGLPNHGYRLGAISCNKHRLISDGKECTAAGNCEEWDKKKRAYFPPASDAWYGILADVKAGVIDVLLHVGDEVYLDDDLYRLGSKTKGKGGRSTEEIEASCTWCEANNILEGTPEADWDSKKDEIKELFRQGYRKTWSHEPTAQAMANIPNLFVADDHDLRDDWGDGFETAIDDYLARCAMQVAYEYQYLVSLDVSPETEWNTNTPAHYGYTVGSVGVVFVDVRIGPYFRSSTKEIESHLGSDQWSDLYTMLGEMKSGNPDEGIWGDVQFLVVATPMPIAYFTEGMLTLGQHAIDDMAGMWGMAKQEQKQFFDLLLCWKDRKPGREVVVVAGDVHHGVKTEIRRNAYTVFYQLVTSPISNVPVPGMAGVMAYAATKKLNKLGGLYTYKHDRFLTGELNYGTVVLSTGDLHGVSNQPKVKLQNWISDGKGGKKESPYTALENTCKPAGATCRYIAVGTDRVSECCHGHWCEKETSTCVQVPGLECEQCRGKINGTKVEVIEGTRKCDKMFGIRSCVRLERSERKRRLKAARAGNHT